MHEWLKFNNITTFNILTKCDYISRSEVNKKLAQIEKTFQNQALAFCSKDTIYKDKVLSVFLEFIK